LLESDERNRYQQNGIEVKTNRFVLEWTGEDGDYEWYTYHVQIVPCKWLVQKDAEGRPIRDANNKLVGELVPRRPETATRSSGMFASDKVASDRDDEEKEERKNESNAITRRVLRKLQAMLRAEGKHMVTDGSALAYAPKILFDITADTSQEAATLGSAKSNAGYYGPADDGTAQGGQARSLAPSKIYQVVVKKGSDEDDEQVKNDRFMVKLSLVGTIKFSVNNQKFAMDNTQVNAMTMMSCLNTALKSAMINSMHAFDRSPRMFYVKLNQQTRDLLGRALGQMANDPSYQPLVGLVQTAVLTGNAKMILAADLSIGWSRPEKTPQSDQPIPLINKDTKTVAGVQVSSLSEPIPASQREAVRAALMGMTFHIKYTKSQEWYVLHASCLYSAFFILCRLLTYLSFRADGMYRYGAAKETRFVRSWPACLYKDCQRLSSCVHVAVVGSCAGVSNRLMYLFSCLLLSF
jgi:hypothetical protein